MGKDSKTTDKPPVRVGRGGVPPPQTTKPFTKENQPSSESKKAGWAKRKTAKEVVKAVTELKFIGAENSEILKKAAKYYGIPQKEITVLMMMVFRQIEKSIQSADTGAFNSVMDRGFGRPEQPITGDKDLPLKIIVSGTKKR